MMMMGPIHAHGLAFLDGAMTAWRVGIVDRLRAVIACADDDDEYGAS